GQPARHDFEVRPLKNRMMIITAGHIFELYQRLHNFLHKINKCEKCSLSKRFEIFGHPLIYIGGPCGAAAPPMPPLPALAQAKPDARLRWDLSDRAGPGIWLCQ